MEKSFFGQVFVLECTSVENVPLELGMLTGR